MNKLTYVLIPCIMGLATAAASYLSMHPSYRAPEPVTESFFYEGLEYAEAAQDQRYGKQLIEAAQEKRFVNKPAGYYVDLDKQADLDLSLSPLFVKASSGLLDITISREYSPYQDVDGYIDYYLNRFILDSSYRTHNGLVLVEAESMDMRGYGVKMITIRGDYFPDGLPSMYTYITITDGTPGFYRIMCKYDYHTPDEAMEQILALLDSFTTFTPEGEDRFETDFAPQIPEFWSEETKRTYEHIANSENIGWGVFVKDVYEEGIDHTIPDLEQKLDYHFPVTLCYLDCWQEFPMEFMQKNYADGKLVELTYHITTTNNMDLFFYTPQLFTYWGERDEEIREFARKAKEFGHPFLFRLNNEMNTDWTSYSGVVNLSDPDIYKEVWKRYYRIFQEEGVDNAIWVFNPNGENYPPCNWNNFLAYYPGDEYVQMIGLTGYNTGTYYQEETGEKWRSFETIYDRLEEEYMPFFSKFPWIITEFASSSHGGDKAQWIRDMFGKIGDYENIKLAVWFSSADVDLSDPANPVAARPYWLDETPETLQAMKEGLLQTGPFDWHQDWLNAIEAK